MPKKSQAAQRPREQSPVDQNDQPAPEEFDDPLEDRFFSALSLAPVELEVSGDEDGRPPARIGALWTALGIATFSAVALGAFLVFHRAAAPLPVEIGTAVPTLAPIEQWRVPEAMGPSPAEPLAVQAQLAVQAPLAVQAQLAIAEVETLSDALTTVEPVAPEPEASELATVAEDPAPIAQARPSHGRGHRRGRGSLARQAFSSLNRGDFDRAERLAARATTAHPRDADGWLVLAAARDALGDVAGAQRAYRMCTAKVGDAAKRNCRRLVN